MSDWLRWQRGRQQSGYDKLLFAQSKRLKFDCWLLRYPPGASIAGHTDPVAVGQEHHRLNIEIWRSPGGGVFHLNGMPQMGRIHRFRPDIVEHSVTQVSGGSRYVLSIGWLRRYRYDR